VDGASTATGLDGLGRWREGWVSTVGFLNVWGWWYGGSDGDMETEIGDGRFVGGGADDEKVVKMIG
jgi:hypothetical protein